jgi:hypothetical protein
MHGAKAALESRQVHAASHQGVISQFGLHFVRTDLIEREWGARISDSFLDRLTADHDATAVFDETDADQACGRAAVFLDRIRELLGPDLAPGDGDGRSSPAGLAGLCSERFWTNLYRQQPPPITHNLNGREKIWT